MKKKFTAVALFIVLLMGLAACASKGTKGYESNTGLVAIPGFNDLYYDSQTKVAEKSSKRNEGRRKTGRAYRRKMRRKTIQKYRNGNGWIYGPHLRGHWEGDKFVLGSYVKHPQNSSNKAFFKRVSNKKVRRSNGVPAKGNGYRKIFDYWWTID